MLLSELASLDSNNFLKNSGVGEREARIASSLVAKRNYYLGHGIGRSGDLVEVQPKAAGSSVMYRLTNLLATDVLKATGVRNVKQCFVAPLATGMSLTLLFLSLRQSKPSAKFVIWSRIDQKSCFKSIIAAGFIPVIVNLILNGDQLQSDVKQIESELMTLDPELVACVMTTTSCFAPRACDDIETVAELCQKYNTAHIINNAYGVQSSKCMHLIEQASRYNNHFGNLMKALIKNEFLNINRKGRVDAFVQSTDKNFMVPVGGTIIAGFDEKFIAKVSQCYPGKLHNLNNIDNSIVIHNITNLLFIYFLLFFIHSGRASSSPILDLFITFLSVGSKDYLSKIKERKEHFKLLKIGLTEIATKFHLRVLETPGNSISIGIFRSLIFY